MSPLSLFALFSLLLLSLSFLSSISSSSPFLPSPSSPSSSALSSPTFFSGLWRYRSFFNLPDANVNASHLLFAHGNLNISVSSDGTITGFLLGGDFRNPSNVWSMTVKGFATQGQWGGQSSSQGFMTALGIPNTTSANWNYQYVFQQVPTWRQGTGQIDSFVGSVIRNCCHEPQGLVANLASTRATAEEEKEMEMLRQEIEKY